MEQYQDTLIDLSQAIAQRPDDARVLAHRGETYRLLGRYQEALADFDRTIELKPNYAWAIAHRGETYRLLERYQEALADFDRTNELKPNYAWALAHRGIVYYQMKHYDKALTDLNWAIELKPDYIWALIHQVRTYIMLRRYQEALADFDQVISLDKSSINHWRGERGLILNYLGRYSETITCCEQALLENPDDYVALYSLTVAKICWKGLAETQTEIDKTQAVLQPILKTEARADALYRLGGLAALEDKVDQGLTYLQEAILLDDEALELAYHDPAWSGLADDPRYQLIVSKRII